MTLRLEYALRSDVGHVREGNEDSAFAGSRLLAVADGMGGHAAGEVASSTVISLLAPLDVDVDPADLEDALADAIDASNARLRAMTAEDGSLGGMGTTVTALLASGPHLGLLHVGDSRAYLLRDGICVQITHDHTLVQDLVDAGRITAEQATTHPQRSLLMRALDGRDVEPDLEVLQAELGDRYLLCTDGLSTVVRDETIADSLMLPTPQEAVDQLVELALKGGGPDNVTVIVADVVDDELIQDQALVAGAAAEKHSVAGALPVIGGGDSSPATDGSAAARAALVHRLAGGPPDEDGPLDGDPDTQPQAVAPAAPPRRRGRRRLLAGGGAVVLIIAVLVGGYAYLQSQYYVGVDHDQVALFRGVEGSIVGVSLHSVEQHSVPVSELTDFARAQASAGITAKSKADAQSIMANLEKQTRPTPQPTPTVTPTPTPTRTFAPCTAQLIKAKFPCTPVTTPKPTTPKPTSTVK